MDIHRTRFVNYQPSSITHLIPSPTHFPHPQTAVVRSSSTGGGSQIEIWSATTNSYNNQSETTGVPRFAKDGNRLEFMNDHIPTWTLLGVIYNDNDNQSIESITWITSTSNPNSDLDSDLNSGFMKLRLFVGFVDGSLIEYDLQSFKRVQKTDSMGGGVIWSLIPVVMSSSHHISNNNDSELLLAGCDDGLIRVYDISNGQLDFVRSFERGSSAGNPVISMAVGVLSMAAAPVVYSGANDGKIRVWDVASGRCTGRMVVGRPARKGEDLFVWSLQPLKGNCLASGDSRGSVMIWDCVTQTLIQSFHEHEADVLTLCTNSTGDILFAAGIDPKITMFERVGASVGDEVEVKWILKHYKRPHTHDIRALAWLQTRRLDLTVSGVSGSFKKRPFDSSVVVAAEEEKVVKNPSEMALDCLVSGGVDTQLTVHPTPRWSFAKAYQPVRIPQPLPQHLISVSSKSDRLLATIDNTLNLYRLTPSSPPVADAQFVAKISVGSGGDGCNIITSCPSPDGTLVYAADSNGKSHLYRISVKDAKLESIAFPYSLNNSAAAVCCSVFLSDSLLIVCDVDYSVHVLEISDTSVKVLKSFNFTKIFSKLCASRFTRIVADNNNKVAIGDAANRIFLLDIMLNNNNTSSLPEEGSSEEVIMLPFMENFKFTCFEFANIDNNSGDQYLIISTMQSAKPYFESCRFYFYNIHTDSFNLEYQEALQKINWLSVRKQPVLQIETSSSDKLEGALYLNGRSWMTRILFSQLVKLCANLKNVPDESPESEKLMEEIQSCNQITQKFENLLFFKFFGISAGGDDDEVVTKGRRKQAVVVERPWSAILENFPPAFEYKMFGGR